ncbi:MAG: chalcone isomerase family protein [Marinicella sp.]
MKLFICMLSLILIQLSASAKNLPESIEHQDDLFQLCDQYTLRYGFVIKVAEIGWYAPECKGSSVLTELSHKILRFHYHKNVAADFFKKSAEEYFLLNLQNQEEQKILIDHLRTFNDAYTDISSGEYFDLIHWKDKQLSLWKNKQLLIKTEHAAFARQYFNIWFGEVPVIEKLKSAFLE